MKRKTMILILGLVFAILLFLYLIPLLEEFRKVELNLMGLCIGTGCYSSSSTYSFGFGSVGCSGYQVFGFFCPTDAEKYCKYMKPFDSNEKCLCELKDYKDYKSHRFCEKNNLCYGNSFEYEFGCSEEREQVCKKIEKEISDSWLDRYAKSDKIERKDIFERGYIARGGPIEGEAIYIKDICKLLCNTCNSVLCKENYPCEYAKYLSE